MIDVQWNLSITTTPNGIILCLLELIWVAKGHLDVPQKAEIVSKSKLVPSVSIKSHYWINYR